MNTWATGLKKQALSFQVRKDVSACLPGIEKQSSVMPSLLPEDETKEHQLWQKKNKKQNKDWKRDKVVEERWLR